MKIGKKLYKIVKEIKIISRCAPEHLRNKIVNVGMIGEIECCYYMRWDISDVMNNKGFDAINANGQKIQIKTFVKGNKTEMVSSFNPRAEKNKDVEKLVIVILNTALELDTIFQVSIGSYKKKLLEVEIQRTQNSKAESRVERFDLTISQFEKIKGIKKLYGI